MYCVSAIVLCLCKVGLSGFLKLEEPLRVGRAFVAERVGRSDGSLIVVDGVRAGVGFVVYVVRCGKMGVSGSRADNGEDTFGEAVSFVFESTVATDPFVGFGSFAGRAPGSVLRDFEKGGILDS